jgi:hypothetical protein
MIGEFFKSVPAEPAILIKMKVLVTCHVILGDFTSGKLFSSLFSSWSGFRWSSEEACHEFANVYLSILQKLA